MKFVFTEDALTRLETWGYRGVIGLFWNTTLGGILSFLVFATIVILAIIGLITIVKWFSGRKSRKMDPHEKWLKTGKM